MPVTGRIPFQGSLRCTGNPAPEAEKEEKPRLSQPAHTIIVELLLLGNPPGGLNFSQVSVTDRDLARGFHG